MNTKQKLQYERDYNKLSTLDNRIERIELEKAHHKMGVETPQVLMFCQNGTPEQHQRLRELLNEESNYQEPPSQRELYERRRAS